MLKLQDVWNLSDRFADERGVGTNHLFEECGLKLERRPHRWEYFCTPRNSITFADLGLDGTHFGFLILEGLPQESQPIVMTVPMNDRQNYIIAESLEEFLGLGYYVGWLALDQIAFGPDKLKVETYFSQRNLEFSPEQEEMLVFIRDGLQLRHVPLSFARLTGLDEKFGRLIDDGEEPEESAEDRAALATFLATAELAEVARKFQEAAIEKETFGGSRRDTRLYRIMALAYHRLNAAGDTGRLTLRRLLSDSSSSVKGWIATALLVDGDASARAVLEELKDDISSRTVLEQYDEGKLRHPFSKKEST